MIIEKKAHFIILPMVDLPLVLFRDPIYIIAEVVQIGSYKWCRWMLSRRFIGFREDADFMTRGVGLQVRVRVVL